MSEPASEGPQDKKASIPSSLPAASFKMLVATLATQATSALGQLPDPISGKTEVRLDLAKHVIDTISILESKTKGNLSDDERVVLEGSLHQLRLAYLEAAAKKG